MTTVTQAVALRDKQDQVITWLRRQQDDIAMAAATHIRPSAIIRVTQGALRRDEKLARAAVANPQSLLYALLECARLGHEPDTDDYYLVPFGSEVTGIEGYKGIIERMYRAQGVTSVVAQVVRQRDRYRSRGENTPPDHEFDDFASPADRGPMRGAYAYATLAGGRCSQVIRMGEAEINQHKAASRGADKPDSPWQRWPEAMWKKTVLRALEPYVPTSTEYRDANRMARPDLPASVALGLAANGNAAEPAVIDGEIVTEPEPKPQAPAGRQPQRASQAALRKLDGHLTALSLGPPEDVQVLFEWVLGKPYEATPKHVSDVTGWLESHLEASDGDAGKAAGAVWDQYRAAHPQENGDG